MNESDTSTVFERAARGQPVPHTPVWIMRQAGRYLPEYRKLRRTVDFITATRTPEIAARITLQPMQRFEMDASILFSDIMTPLDPMGVSVDFKPGPVLPEPVRTPEKARAVRELVPEEGVPFVLDAIRAVRSELRPEAALIGFAGAPFTLFCYLVEGGGSKDFMTARSFLRREPEASQALLRTLGRSMARYLVAQAGAAPRRHALRFLGRHARSGELPAFRPSRPEGGLCHSAGRNRLSDHLLSQPGRGAAQ